MNVRRFLLYFCPFSLVALVLALAPFSICRAESPYGNILNSIKKRNVEETTGQQQAQPGKAVPSPQPTPSPVTPVPMPVKQPAPPSLKGKNIKANLELTVSVNGSAHDSSSEKNATSVSSYQSSGTTDSMVDGKAIISVAFEEAPAFPDIPASNAMVLAPVGTFTYYLDRKKVRKSQWSGSEKVLGDYIVHPQKQGSFQGHSNDEESIRCEGREVYEGVKYVTAAVPGMNVPQQQVRHLGPGPILNLQEQPDGTMKYSFSVDTMGQCTVKNISGSHTGSSSDSYHSEDHFVVSIEGTFPKGQKVVQLTPENVDHYFPTKTEAGGKSQKLKVTITGTLSFIAKPGKLQVTPGDGLASSGPDDKDQFTPASKTYVLKNTGESSINYKVSKAQKWLTLSNAEGKLEPNQTAQLKASVNQQVAKDLKEGDYKDTLTFANVTNGSGDTSRQASLNVGEEQTWRVLLSGQETDDVGGKLMYMKIQDKWGYKVVEYGVRFNYKLTAEFTIRKKKGKWIYKKGTIKSASVTPVNVFDPDVFFVKDTVCKNCDVVNGLAGQSLGGEVDGSTVTLYWPKKITNVVVYNKLKLQHNSKEETHKGYSANEFFSESFFVFASSHELPLKNGEVPPKKQERDSSLNQFRQKNKKPIFVYYRYVMQRIK